MAILKTCKTTVYVPASKINPVILYIRDASVMEMAEGIKSLPKSAVNGVERELLRVDSAICEARRIVGKKTFVKKRRGAVSADKKHTDSAWNTVEEILTAKEKNEKNLQRIKNLGEDMEKYRRFLSFDGTNFAEETQHTKMCVFCKGTTDLPEIPCYCEDLGDAVFCVYLKRDSEMVENTLKKHGFSLPEVSLDGFTPSEAILLCKSKREELLAENEQLFRKLKKLSKGLSQMELLYDTLLLKKERYQAFSSAKNTEKVFILTGYVLKIRIDEFKEKIAELGGFAMEIPPEDGEIMPTQFENNSFVEPVEEVTASYAMPGGTDIDPNPVMSVFYYWFFGMMFSDAGYGLLMMAACGALGFSKTLEREKRGMFRMFFWCGVSTFLWGIAYGSFFGDLIGTLSGVFGKGDVAFLPVLIDPVNQALELLIISVAFGLVHILTALFIKFSMLWKSGEKQEAVFDVGSWILVLLGVAVLSTGAGFGNVMVKTIGILVAAVGVIILVAMSGRKEKNLIKRLFSGILSLYDITGFVGDILSYSRLMALGLATGVIASVVNVLASLGGNSVLGAILFVAVAVFGHSLNFAINMLGAYVHTNRLQYVEFYQKFYTGGGKRFQPVGAKTKYFDFGKRD